MNVLISLDGLSYKSFERWSQSFIDLGFSYCKKMITTFPSVTFNAHATAITGNSHDQHLIFDNVVADVANAATIERIALYGDHELLCNEALHRQTLFYSLAMHDLKSSCIHWPLTTGNPYIHYLVAESSSKKKIEQAGSAADLDTVALHETIQAIESGSYDFIAARFVGYDALSHQYGKDSMEAIHCAESLIGHIHHIYDTLSKSQQAFNLFIFSDHGQSDVQSFFYPNEILAQSRWREHLLNKQIRFIGDGSGSLLFYSRLTQQENQEIMSYFNRWEQVNHFYELGSGSGAESGLGFGSEPGFGSESGSGSGLESGSGSGSGFGTWPGSGSAFRPVGILDLKHTICGEDILAPEQPQYEAMKSLHGYHPDQVEEMNGFMLGIGDRIKQGQIIEQSHLVNIAPTIAKVFQIPHHCKGREIQSLISDTIKEHE
ncbi:alkaline phosphatase family protein [Paenibacillus eucommiae]|uniref:AP protein n=1 Tax=Paenibacillus eucommiae TaxID=1355755 RepID=A0ABS4J0Y5_9BACL|nr:alkaline phosphatase family protein [Paenibacillus eucommiae]MBP1992926.1 hypothetical protein [Paenibacillus eucommiae]